MEPLRGKMLKRPHIKQVIRVPESLAPVDFEKAATAAVPSGGSYQDHHQIQGSCGNEPGAKSFGRWRK